jgi:nitroimidazol reductase NimA-like FMN-containing flavoprotein (pyridoxamine 5'-phosphate oxidase superfamily)
MRNQHEQNIRDQLVAAGITRYSLRKNEVKYLPNVIHKDEVIGAAVSGKSDLGSVMLVATDKRVIFLDCKSFYTTVDELTYDVVSGVALHVQGLFANVTLHTRVGEYNLRLVNLKQANRFTEYIEKMKLEIPLRSALGKEEARPDQAYFDENKIISLKKPESNFLNTHYLGVLSSIDRTGNVYGATVYYLTRDSKIFFLTKSETEKARNIISNPRVAFTVFEELTYETLQISGLTKVVTDTDIRNQVFQNIMKIRNMQDNVTTPPVTKINQGSYVVFEIGITEAKYYKYK